MALLDKFFGKKVKTLSELSKQELRKEEILIGKQRDRLFKKIEVIAADKQKIFQQGAAQKSPELRKALAQQFELKSQEQVMAARELNIRSKELMTVGRLRMVKENQEGGKALGRLNVTDKDMVKITAWIEDDAVSQEMYTERLDQILELGEQADKDAIAQSGLASAGNELMHLWDQMDKGDIKEDEALDEANKATRRKGGAMEKEI
ncbi:MAG TPA: hypothetical protein VK986_26115 [Tepidisphaeraceae bacterium]|nr:hypothetical protein [Tepidisphaeraceae bacterium]